MNARAPAPRHLQRLDHAHQGPARHALDRHPHAGRHQDHRRRPPDHRAHREGDRGRRPEGPGHAQRLRRARRRRLLPRLRAEARPARPLRPLRRRRQHDGHDRGRRRQPDDHGRGARALRHQRPLRARLPRGPLGAAARAAAAAERPGPDPDGGDRRRRARAGPVDDPRRERAARRLRLRRLRHLEDRRRQLRDRGEEGGRRGGPAAHRLLPDLERPVREHAAREGAAEAHPAAHARAHLRAALHEHEVGLQGGARDAGGAVLGHRRGLAPLGPRLQRLDRGLGGDDRAHGARRRDRRLHAPLPRPLARRVQGEGPAPHAAATSSRPSSTAR